MPHPKTLLELIRAGEAHGAGWNFRLESGDRFVGACLATGVLELRAARYGTSMAGVAPVGAWEVSRWNR